MFRRMKSREVLLKMYIVLKRARTLLGENKVLLPIKTGSGSLKVSLKKTTALPFFFSF